MSTITVKAEKDTLNLLEQLVDLVSDPIRAYLFIEIVRNPGITPNNLKKRLMLKGSKIYFHLKKMEEYDIIEGSGTEEVEYHNQQLSRRKYEVSKSIFKILNQLAFNDFINLNQSKIYQIMYLLQLYLGVAFLQQKVREARGKNLSPSNPSMTIMAFVDKEIADIITQGIVGPINTCVAKYKNKNLAEVIKECTFGVVAGVFPMD